MEWRGEDLNLRPSGYEPDELPDCSTPRQRCEPVLVATGIYEVNATHVTETQSGPQELGKLFELPRRSIVKWRFG